MVVRPAKTKISLDIRPVWSVWSVFAVRFMGSLGPKLSSSGQRRLWSDWADARLIWVFAGHTATLLVLSWGGSIMCVSGFPTLYRFLPRPLTFYCELWAKCCQIWWKMGENVLKMQFLYKIFWQNKMLCRPTIPSFFRAETWDTHIYIFGLMMIITSRIEPCINEICARWGSRIRMVRCLQGGSMSILRLTKL